MAAPDESQQTLAQAIADTILEGFDRHFRIFQQITSGAIQRFEQADWHSAQQASRERIVLYDQRVSETLALIRKDYKVDELNTALWRHCLLYTSPSPRDLSTSRMPSSA